MNGKWTSSKLIAFAIIFISATTFFTFKYVSSDQWIEVVKWLFGIFVGGNVAATIAHKLGFGNGGVK